MKIVPTEGLKSVVGVMVAGGGCYPALQILYMSINDSALAGDGRNLNTLEVLTPNDHFQAGMLPCRPTLYLHSEVTRKTLKSRSEGPLLDKRSRQVERLREESHLGASFYLLITPHFI